jgi:hypothetical protein
MKADTDKRGSLLVALAIPLGLSMYFLSLGPAHVIGYRACRACREPREWRTAERPLLGYSQPAYFLTSRCDPIRRITADYIGWWLRTTHTHPPWKTATYWYDS